MDLLLNFIATAIINLTPALVIRYLVKKRPLNKKSHAIVACVIVAISAWSIAYFIAFSPIGSGIIPTGFAEVIFGFINFYMLKPTASNDNIPENELSHTALFDEESTEMESPSSMATESDDNQHQNTPVTKSMDATMQEYFNAMIPVEVKDNNPIPDVNLEKTKKMTKVSIVLNIILVIALCVSVKTYVDTNARLADTKLQLLEVQKSYDKSVKARNSMMERYEEQIRELNKKLYPDREIDFDEVEKYIQEKHKKNMEKWNKENPDQPINEAGQPL